MTTQLGLFGLLAIGLALYAAYNIWNSSATTGAKIVWSVVLFFLPFLGFIAWLIFGPRGR
ncbi:MAG: PLDc N-terminal domain-containing protein [Dinoroseobacter sp.]|nr:PLDc N-terminal domain-containing protein [Dinoroseobacter sp.]MDJ0993092.1 PLDc N-terminal domain-containing protein [Dinoroseobacter sp.]